MTNLTNPHQDQPVLTAGLPIAQAKAAMILVHGRGATAESILTLANELYHPNWAYLAPQANSNTWYPYSFLAPIPHNEPGITSGLQAIADVVAQIVQGGIPHEQIVLLGFSQGACLTLEFAARHARRYRGIVGFSGGLIGPDGTPRDYAGLFEDTPVFLGCSDVDFHIPKQRVEESAEVFKRMKAAVTARLYPGMGHTVNQDEIEFVRGMMGIPNQS